MVGGLEISELLMSIISIYAAAYCWYSNGHLRITFLRERVSPRAGDFLDLLSTLFFAVWIGAVAFGMWEMALTHIRTGAKGWGLGVPFGPFMAAFFLASTFFFLVLAKDFFSILKKLFGRDSKDEETG